MKPAIVFDLDGTLADSIPTVLATAAVAFADHGLAPPDPERLRRAIGLPLAVVLQRGATGPVPDVDALTDTYRARYEPIAAVHERLFPGIEALLDALRAAGHPLAVATGKSHAGAVAACARLGLDRRVDVVHGIPPGTPGKPDPAVLLRALGDLDRPPAHAIVVGDSPHDVHMARAGGVRVIAVTWGGHDRDELAATGPDAIVDAVDALAARLLG